MNVSERDTDILCNKTPLSGGLAKKNIMDYTVRSLSTQESRVVLALAEQKRREVGRPEIIKLLGVSARAADNVIESLRRKGWLAYLPALLDSSFGSSDAIAGNRHYAAHQPARSRNTCSFPILGSSARHLPARASSTLAKSRLPSYLGSKITFLS
jgi:hypothetical protein